MRIIPFSWCFLATFLPFSLGLGGLAGAQHHKIKPAMMLRCTPDMVVGAGVAMKVRNPIAHALEMAGPGSTILLESGSYPAFTIGQKGKAPDNARTSGGLPGRPITIQGNGRVTISAKGNSDAIRISQQIRNGHFLFRNITIEPGYRAGILFMRGGVHEGFRFWDCHIKGKFNHATKRGDASKWGVWGTQLKDFEFKGVQDYATISNLRDEHGFYLQNLKGNVTVERVKAFKLGRTFFQLIARDHEGPPGIGTVTLRDCVVNDVALAPGDAHKGGYAFTFGGRHTGTIIVESCVYRAGFETSLRHLTQQGSPYGTGALVAVDRKLSLSNGTLILRNNIFEMAEGCGERAVVSIGGCRTVRVEGMNRIRSGGKWPALAIDPVRKKGGTQLISRRNGEVQIGSGTRVDGGFEVLGVKIVDPSPQYITYGF